METIVKELNDIVAAFSAEAMEEAYAASSGCDICLSHCADNCAGSGDWN